LLNIFLSCKLYSVLQYFVAEVFVA